MTHRMFAVEFAIRLPEQSRMWNSMQLRFWEDRCRYLHSTFYVLVLPIVLTLFVLVQNPLVAQAPEGTIRGVVKDVSGAVVTQTSLRVSQPQFGGGRVVGTDVYGQYYITNLDPGDYEIEAFAPGFNTEVKHAIDFRARTRPASGLLRRVS